MLAVEALLAVEGVLSKEGGREGCPQPRELQLAARGILPWRGNILIAGGVERVAQSRMRRNSKRRA